MSATSFSLVYGMEAVLPIEVEIPSLRVLMETKLEEAEWVKNRYDQLNLIKEKCIGHCQMHQRRMIRVHNKKRCTHDDLKWTSNWERPYAMKQVFFEGASILSEIDGNALPNPVNSDPVKKYYTQRAKTWKGILQKKRENQKRNKKKREQKKTKQKKGSS